MPRLHSLTTVFVDTVPDHKEPGTLYVSEKFHCAIHLCACGCGGQVTMPFSIPERNKYWGYVNHGDGTVTFYPSILSDAKKGLCGSHYFIERNKIRWV